jgi:hypothetical protein
MNSFFSGLLNAALSIAVQTASQANQNGAGLKGTGTAALLGSLLGVTAFLATRPMATHPAVVAATAAAVALPIPAIEPSQVVK